MKVNGNADNQAVSTSPTLKVTQLLMLKLRTILLSTKGAIDLASIMVGVLVLGILGGIVGATVFAVIPWAQDHAAKAQLDAVRQAENVYAGFTATGDTALGKGDNGFAFVSPISWLENQISSPASTVKADGKSAFGTYPELVAKKLIAYSDNVNVGPAPDGSCFTTTVLSSTGKVFWSDSITGKTGVLTNSSVSACTDAPLDGVLPKAYSDALAGATPAPSTSAPATTTPPATTAPTSTPTATADPTKLTASALSTGGTSGSSVLLQGDGKVYGWGVNNFSQLDGTTTKNYYSPAVVSNLTFKQIIATNSYTLGLTPAGTLYQQGKVDGYGPTGVGFAQISGITGIVQIAGGTSHALALKSDGTVYAWGSNSYGQTANVTNASIPTKISLTGVSSIAISENASFAVKTDGTVYSWGQNSNMQLGTGNTTTTASTASPTQISGLAGINSIAARNENVYAVSTSQNKVWAWGDNSASQFGNNNTTVSASPVLVTALTGKNVTKVEVQNATAVAYTSDGTTYAWGFNRFGQLGLGHANVVTVPTLFTVAGKAVIGTAATAGNTYYLTADGSVYVTGQNGTFSGLGYTTYQNSNAMTPVLVKIIN